MLLEPFSTAVPTRRGEKTLGVSLIGMILGIGSGLNLPKTKCFFFGEEKRKTQPDELCPRGLRDTTNNIVEKHELMLIIPTINEA